jgi:N utilization substance protein B
MQTLFALQSREIDPAELLVHTIRELVLQGSVDEDFALTLLSGVQKEWDDVRKAIEVHAPEWPLERMDTITRSILMMGAYELLKGNDAPPAVVMNEAIDIAKEYGTAESGKFVNGVLNALAKHIKK